MVLRRAVLDRPERERVAVHEVVERLDYFARVFRNEIAWRITSLHRALTQTHLVIEVPLMAVWIPHPAQGVQQRKFLLREPAELARAI